MKGLIRDLLLPVAVLLALPLGMLGPALTLPLLVYTFPLVLAAMLAGLFMLLRPARAKARRQEAPLQDLSGRPPAGAAVPEKLPSTRVLESTRRPVGLPDAVPLGGGPFRRILVLISPDDFDLRALARVAATAKRDGAQVVLASVVSAEDAALRQDLPGNLTHHPRLIRMRLDKELENLCWRLGEAGVKASRRVELEEPALQVPALARREEADLVVLTPRRGRLLQARAAMPDWARAVPCPVMALAS